MPKAIYFKNKKLIGLKEVIVIFTAIILTTAGIKAADSLFNEKNIPLDKGLCPEEMVFVSSANGGFCIDMFEASPNDSCTYKEVADVSETRVNLSDSKCWPKAGAGNLPWRFVSQDQAALACAKAGKRLPTAAEWLQAALGTPDKNNSNDECQTKNNWLSQPGPAGSGKNCVSSSGAYDMIGNVWEWTSGTVNNSVYNNEILPLSGYIDGNSEIGLAGKTNPNIPNPDYNNDYFWIKNNGLRAIARGGYWDNGQEAGVYSAYIVIEPGASVAGVGFRCVK